MTYNKTLLIAIVCACTGMNACAQPKKAATPKIGSTHARLIECTEQTTMPGRPEMEPTTHKRMLIVWKSKTPPHQIFWRGQDGWTDCIIAKARKNNNKQPKYEFGENWYDTEEILPEKVKRGDTLELTLMYGGKNTIPDEVTPAMKNRIFLKTEKSQWMFLPVNMCRKLPSIAMP
jgi:hypothetical protein